LRSEDDSGQIGREEARTKRGEKQKSEDRGGGEHIQDCKGGEHKKKQLYDSAPWDQCESSFSFLSLSCRYGGVLQCSRIAIDNPHSPTGPSILRTLLHARTLARTLTELDASGSQWLELGLLKKASIVDEET